MSLLDGPSVALLARSAGMEREGGINGAEARGVRISAAERPLGLARVPPGSPLESPSRRYVSTGATAVAAAAPAAAQLGPAQRRAARAETRGLWRRATGVVLSGARKKTKKKSSASAAAAATLQALRCDAMAP